MINALLNAFYNVWVIVRMQYNVLLQQSNHINIICDSFFGLISSHIMKRHGGVGDCALKDYCTMANQSLS